MPAQSHPIRITVYGIDNLVVSGATVTLTLNSETTSETTDSNGQCVLNVGNLSSWSAGDSVSITASKTNSGTKTETLTLTSAPQTLTITLAETSDLSYYEQTETDMYNLNFSLLTTYDGEKVTTANPLPIKTQDPLAGYHSTDIARGDPEYHGYLDKDGGWYIVKYSRAAGTRRFARGSASYSTNWTNRASLTYSYFNEVF
jgi:hypothetical protein